MNSGRTLVLVLLIVMLGCSEGANPEATESDPNTPIASATVDFEATTTPRVASPTASPTLIAPTSTPTETPPPATAESTFSYFASPEYGIQAFLWWRPDIAQRDLALVQGLEFGWVKQSFAWRDIETLEKGKYDWWRPDNIVQAVEEAGLQLLVRIDRQPFWSQAPGSPIMENSPPADYQDFSDFCSVLAERYKGRIAAYQVWNEPNLSREWGEEPPNPEEYTSLLRGCYQAIKAADPQAIVVSAGLAPTGTGLPLAMPDTDYLRGLYEAGASEFFDVLGVNAPGYKASPETAPEEGENNPEYGGGRWFVFRHVEDLRTIMEEEGDGHKQVAILEMGWTTDSVNPTYAWHAVSEEQQADYLVRAYRYARENWNPWIGLMVTIYIADYDWTPEVNEQWWWSITLPDGSLRPAYKALQAMEK